MANYKLIYFDLKGRAESSRILFALSGVEYQDVRLTFQEWPTEKSKFLFLQAPVLEVTENGQTVQICQSNAILRFLASRFNLAGRNDIEKAQCDMIHEEINDIFNHLVQFYAKQDSEEKSKGLEKAMNELVPNKLKLIQNILDSNKSGYLVGDSISYVDVVLLCFYDWLRDQKQQVLDKLPGLKKHEEKVKSNSIISEHLKKYQNSRLTILF